MEDSSTGDLFQRKARLSPDKKALLEHWLAGNAPEPPAQSGQRSPEGSFPLSFAQQRQWFMELLEPGSPVNHLSFCLQLTGSLDVLALERCINMMIARHDIFRTSFSAPSQESPEPRIAPILNFQLVLVDGILQGLPEEAREPFALHDAQAEAMIPFNLDTPPLFRIKLYRLTPVHHVLFFLIHHMLFDGWSWGVALREMLGLYQGMVSGRPLALAEPVSQFAEFALWQRRLMQGETIAAQIAYWKEQLRGPLPVLELPSDLPRPARQSSQGRTLRWSISSEVTQKLKEAALQENSTLFMALLTAYAIFLHRLSGQEDILIGSPVANRNHPEFKNSIGPCLNIIAFRAMIQGTCSFRECLRQVRDLALAAYAHQDVSFEKLVEELNPERDLSRMPLFQTMFIFQNYPHPSFDLPELRMRSLPLDKGISPYDLSLIIEESKEHLEAAFEYNTGIFQEPTITGFSRAFQVLVVDLLKHPDHPIASLNLISEDERQQILLWNQTQCDYPKRVCIHDLIRKQMKKAPERVAAVCAADQITYRELDVYSEYVAYQLGELGVKHGTHVAVYLERSLDLLIGLLAVLKAGGVYVPIDPSTPLERVRYILSDAAVQTMLVSRHFGLEIDQKIQLIRLDAENRTTRERKGAKKRNAPVMPEDPAYIMYTSGSTGLPKGVQVSHRALMNLLWSMHYQPGLKAGDVVLASSSIAFDIAALELYLPLMVGAKVVIATQDMVTNPWKLQRAMSEHGVTLLQATPTALQMLLKAGWTPPSTLTILCGGESLNVKLAEQLVTRGVTLWNMYGPTETTIWSTTKNITRLDEPMSIGYPIHNTQTYIVDCYGQLLPIGVAGELYIGGEGVAQGYYQRPALTAEKFVPDTLSDKPGRFLFKTGDKARYLPDGSLCYVGRIDQQVKIRSHRVEPGEIEAVLAQHPSVDEAVVVLKEGSSGNRVLVAYCVPLKDQTPTPENLRAYLKKLLPGYMIPSVFIVLENFPLTISQKVDREALPTPLLSLHHFIEESHAPRNPLEALLANIVARVLGFEHIGIYDNFFDLGGASIQSVEVIAQAQEAGIMFPPELIFEYQTIAALAEALYQGNYFNDLPRVP